MSDGFELKYDFVEKWASFAKPEHFRIYIYILMRYKKDGICLSVEEISANLRTKQELVDEALGFWAAVGYISYQDNNYTFLEAKKEPATKAYSKRNCLQISVKKIAP